MEEYNCDFHLHSKYSSGSSDNMLLPVIARNAELKGLDLVATSDAIHPGWLSHMTENLVDNGNGVYSIAGSKTKFIVTTEVEDAARVHHLILLPSISAAESLRESLKNHSVDIDRDGRPHIKLYGEQLVDLVSEVSGLIGPSHAFTPWTAIFKEYNSLKECYGRHASKIKFLELGLSADTNMADRISELSDVVFLSNSDCHSPLPHRLGREFNRLLLKDLTFNEIKDAIERKNGRKFTLNVGLNPKEGKYHLTACTRCFTRFRIEDALRVKWRCPECKGLIKKGVFDRINELASFKEPKHPEYRPKYIHCLPLAEVISLSIGVKTLTSSRIQELWKKFVNAFGSEIKVLVDVPVSELKKVDSNVGSIIEKFRNGKLNYVAGGGGQYGRPSLTGEKDVFYGLGQKTLQDF